MIESFWRALTTRFLRVANVRQPHRLPLADDRTRAMPIGDRYPGMGDLATIVGDEVPASERLTSTQRVLRQIALFFKRHMSVWKYVPKPIDDDELFYAAAYRELTGTPWRPEAFSDDVDLLADLVVRGPFSFYARRRDNGDYEIDLTELESLQTEQGFLAAGGRAVFTVIDGVVSTRHLEGWGEIHTPTDPGFIRARDRFLAGLGSYVTITDHVLFTHLLTCGAVAVCTFEELPVTHPLRILLQPTIVETVRVNNYNVGALVGFDWSATPAYTRYPVKTVHDMLHRGAAQFRFASMDPLVDTEERGLLDLPGSVTVQSACEIFTIMLEYTTSFCRHYLADLDEPVRAWVARLDKEIPGGVQSYLGIDSLDDVTAEHVARLVAVHAYTASVRHYLVGEATRSYYLFPRWFPPAVPADGSPAPRGIMLEKSNAIAIASIKRYWLLDDSIPMPDASGKPIVDAYFTALRAFRARQVEHDADLRYRIDPEILMSSIHA